MRIIDINSAILSNWIANTLEVLVSTRMAYLRGWGLGRDDHSELSIDPQYNRVLHHIYTSTERFFKVNSAFGHPDTDLINKYTEPREYLFKINRLASGRSDAFAL